MMIPHHARLQEQIETPVCLDESIKTEWTRNWPCSQELPSHQYQALVAGARVPNGRIHDMMEDAGLAVWWWDV